MTPTIGRVVIYNTTEAERKEMENSNTANIAEKLPAIIVAVWSPECVNLNVVLDGEGVMWVTSTIQGDGEGQWNWPVKE